MAGQMTNIATTKIVTYSIHVSYPTAILIVGAIALVIGLIVYLTARQPK